jgi:hypothetical protein
MTSVQRSLNTLLRELSYGPPKDFALVLNVGDAGLLASLDALSSEAASASVEGRSSVAAHVDHLWYGFTMMRRWSQGENPFVDADVASSWKRQRVTDEEWRALRTKLADELRAWLDIISTPREWDEMTMTVMLSTAVHLAYHIGAIRQIAPRAKGPEAND